MNVLIVHAHPEAQSFTSAMKSAAVTDFTAAGHTVVVSDLYAMNWNPVASAADFGSRGNAEYLNYALEQRTNADAQTLAPDIEAELKKLEAAGSQSGRTSEPLSIAPSAKPGTMGPAAGPSTLVAR